MKRNHVTTNATRQMQRATPHRRWKSCAAHTDYQRAVKWFGHESREAQIAFNEGVQPPSILMQLRDQQVNAPRPVKRSTPKARRQSGAFPVELLQWAVRQ